MTDQPDSEKAQDLTEAQERKQDAEADLAEVEHEKARAELEEWKRRASERDREARAKLEELRLKNEDLERAAVKAAVPDLSKVERGSTTVPSDSTLFGALLGGRALEDAAENLVKKVVGRPESGGGGTDQEVRFVVTTDLELAARDARYLAVVEQLKRLTATIGDVLRARPGAVDRTRAVAGPAGAGVAAGLAQLLPGLLSLFSAKRTLTTSASTPDADVTLMAVAGALAASGCATVIVDKTRLLTGAGEVEQAWASLEAGIQKLDEAIAAEEKVIERAAEGADTGESEDWLDAARSLATTSTAAATALTAIPEGGQLSPLAQATLQEALHDPELGGVLVVKAGAASATQLVDDRPLRFGDPVSVISTVTIAYLVIDPEDSHVVVGGLAHGVAQIAGKIGDWLELPAEAEPDEAGTTREELLKMYPVRGRAT